MPDVEREDYFEISVDDSSPEEDFLIPDSGRVKKRRRKYFTGKVEKKNQRKEKLPSKLLLFRHTVIAIFLTLAVGAGLLLLTLPLLKGGEEKKTAASISPPFHLSIEGGIPVVEAFLKAETREDLKPLCVPTSTLDEALDHYSSLTEKEKIRLLPDESPTLINDDLPYYLIYPTNLGALYVREGEGEHRIDLEASIGFNTVTIDALNTFSLKTAENVRLNLFPLPAEKGSIYTRVEGRFPYGGGIIILYYGMNTPIASTIDSQLKKKKLKVPVTVDLSLYDLREPRRYFISSLKSFNWILKNN